MQFIYEQRISSNFFEKLFIAYCALFMALLIHYKITPSAQTTIETEQSSAEIAPPKIIAKEKPVIKTDIIKNITIKRGDSLYRIFNKQGLPKDQIAAITRAVKPLRLAKKLQIGKNLSFRYPYTENPEDIKPEDFLKITYNIDRTKRIEITKTNENKIKAKLINIPFTKVVTKTSATINGSVLASAKYLDTSKQQLGELVSAYSHKVDFQRQVRKGDEITLISEKFYDDNNQFSHYGKILFSSLNLSGQEYNIYNFKHSNKTQFLSEDGSNIRGLLIKTPVNATRISSHFGKRKHPIQGYTKMHKGVDFAAPTGTPIYAAGDGVITRMGWVRGYGRYIKIRHNSQISTAYAHASKFARKLRKGSKVSQGQIIAYVGATGGATGPHLHYEVIKDGRHVNPMKVKPLHKVALSGKEMEDFKKFKKDISNLVVSMKDREETKFDFQDIKTKRTK